MKKLCSEHQLEKSWDCERCVAGALAPLIEWERPWVRQVIRETPYLCLLGGKKCSSVNHVCTPDSTIWDHVDLFKIGRKFVAIRLQPYIQNGANVFELLWDCAERNLEIVFSGGSEWFPGSTFSVWIQNQESKDAEILWRESKSHD